MELNQHISDLYKNDLPAKFICTLLPECGGASPLCVCKALT